MSNVIDSWTLNYRLEGWARIMGRLANSPLVSNTAFIYYVLTGRL